MIFFLIIGVWVVAVFVGLICVFHRESRFLTTHLILGSSFGAVLCFTAMWASVSQLFAVPIGMRTTSVEAEILIVVFAMLVGESVGFIAGSRLAFKLNLRLGWQEEGYREPDAYRLMVHIAREVKASK